MTAQCVRCGAPTDGWACQGCANRAGHHLALIADMTPVARDVAHMQIRQGPNTGGRAAPGLPLDLGATARLDAVQNELTTLARDVAETRRGRPIAHAGGDPIVQAARYLAASLEFLRHQQHADEAFATIEACARIIRGLARGPGEKRYLGPCGAPTLVDVTTFDQPPESEFVEGAPCEGDVYGRPDAELGTCRTCGAQVEQADRRAWLDGEVRGWAFRASEIANAYRLKANTIRVWAARGHIEPVDHDSEGRPLFRVGEVLDRAAAEVVRREAARTRRVRLAEARAKREPTPRMPPPRWPMVGYNAVHQRLKRDRGPASAHPCVNCGRRANDWAYDYGDPDQLQGSDGPYSLDQTHYRPLCRVCHRAEARGNVDLS